MADYVSGEYRVLLGMSSARHPSLWFKITVPAYAETSFPDYTLLVSPQPGEQGVSLAPQMEFSAGTWDYVEITDDDTGEPVYLHFRDQNDDPDYMHQIPPQAAFDPATRYLLAVDTNGWRDTWLGSMITLSFTTLSLCITDMDDDGDVDAADLHLFWDAIPGRSFIRYQNAKQLFFYY